MVTAIVLAGGSGTRLGGDVPKQYLMAGDRPVIGYCLETFEKNEEIQQILVVCAPVWQDFIQQWAERLGIGKLCGYAPGGESRQHSVYNGLTKAKALGLGEEDVVLIHDAARPWVGDAVIHQCIVGAMEDDGAMPVLPVKDTIYRSRNGQIDGLLCRDELFAGQTPESFRFGPYFRLHKGLSDEMLRGIRGSSELAYNGGMNIRLVTGAENNYKITTLKDLEKFCLQLEEKGR